MEALGGFFSRVWNQVPQAALGWPPYRDELREVMNSSAILPEDQAARRR